LEKLSSTRSRIALRAAVQGIIHGDIKPENILFSEDRSCAYLSDFGIAKYFAIEERITTVQGPVGGSIAYLSPEQISYSKQSPLSDIYSLAMVAYELLAEVVKV
jgi:serine/threonine protein kinase